MLQASPSDQSAPSQWIVLIVAPVVATLLANVAWTRWIEGWVRRAPGHRASRARRGRVPQAKRREGSATPTAGNEDEATRAAARRARIGDRLLTTLMYFVTYVAILAPPIAVSLLRGYPVHLDSGRGIGLLMPHQAAGETPVVWAVAALALVLHLVFRAITATTAALAVRLVRGLSPDVGAEFRDTVEMIMYAILQLPLVIASVYAYTEYTLRQAATATILVLVGLALLLSASQSSSGAQPPRQGRR